MRGNNSLKAAVPEGPDAHALRDRPRERQWEMADYAAAPTMHCDAHLSSTSW